MASVYVIRERETKQYWNGFGFTKCLVEARLYAQMPQPEDMEFLTIPVDAMELRLIEREDESTSN